VTIEGMGDTAEGAFRSTSWNDDIDTPENKKYVADYNAKYPDTPAIYIGESAYNSVLALEAAVKKARSLDTEKLIKGLEGVSIDAPSGKLTIRPEDHQATLNVFLTKVEGGKFKTTDSFGEIAPAYSQKETKFSKQKGCG
jgi:branched-chain amino acid transport system substrate-binding protein